MELKLKRLSRNLIEFLELFDIGLPNLGVWYMGMRSQNGSQAFANAIRNADGGPGDNLKISAGFCFVGDPVISGVTKDAVEVVFGDINGPRLGFFISFFGVDETVNLIKQRIKDV